MKIGDIVEVVREDDKVEKGTRGVIIHITHDMEYLVCFEDTKYKGELHCGRGRDETKSSWFFLDKDLNVIEQTLTAHEEIVLFAIQNFKGYANKTSMKALAEALSMRTRDVRECVEHLTVLGYPIGNLNGYFYIETQEELQRVIAYQEARLKSTAKRFRAIKKIRLDKGLL